MDPILINFFLQNIGLPIVAAIVKARQGSQALGTVTSEQVVSDYLADVAKWTAQGKDWLATHPVA